jgi:8-oxo-dGTP diphosphatase
MMKPKTPLLSVDCVIIRRQQAAYCHKPIYEVLMVERKNPPFQGYWALPGGFVGIGETVESAAIREVKEETSLDLRRIRFLDIYDDPNRDVRGHVISFVYQAFPVDICEGSEAVAGDDAESVEWIRVADILEQGIELAFDHYDMISAAYHAMFNEIYPMDNSDNH